MIFDTYCNRKQKKCYLCLYLLMNDYFHFDGQIIQILSIIYYRSVWVVWILHMMWIFYRSFHMDWWHCVMKQRNQWTNLKIDMEISRRVSYRTFEENLFPRSLTENELFCVLWISKVWSDDEALCNVLTLMLQMTTPESCWIHSPMTLTPTTSMPTLLM